MSEKRAAYGGDTPTAAGTESDTHTASETHYSGNGSTTQAICQLARFLAGADDADLDLIQNTWPDAPASEGDREAVVAWLSNHPDLMQAVLVTDPEAPPPEGQNDGWAWRTLEDAYKPKPPREYVVSSILPRPSLDVFYGPPGTLKTMLMIDMALCASTGKDWLEPLPDQPLVQPYACLQSSVLWIDVDNGWDRLERRFAAIGKAHEIPNSASFRYISFPSPPFVASNMTSVMMVIDAATQLGARLIVIDNLGTVSGGADENSSQMIGVMSGLRQIAERSEAAVVVIHHRTKTDKARAGNSLRGHSSIESAVDLALLVEREDGEDSITIMSTKSRDSPVSPFIALWTYDADGPELLSGRFFGMGRPEGGTSNKADEAKTLILDNYEPGRNQSTIVDDLKGHSVGRGTVITALNQLVRDGELVKKDGAANNEKLYFKPDDV